MAATTQRESVRAPKSSEQLKRPGFVERIYNGEGGLQIALLDGQFDGHVYS